MTTYWILLILFGILGGIILQDFRRIESDPPHKGQPTRWGKRVPGVCDEGWGFYPLYPLWYGFILIKVERVPFEVVSEKTRTPDRAESRVPVTITFRPLSNHLSEYIDSGKEAGVKAQLLGQIMERIREWAMGAEEGPATWVELTQAQLEAVSVLVRKIAGPQLVDIPKSAQQVPTWIWLRYYDKPRPTKLLENEKPWAEHDWRRILEVLAEIERVHGVDEVRKLEEAVGKRRAEIDGLRAGTGKIDLPNLGIRLERLNIGDIDVLGEVGKKAENEAKEEQERKAEIKELQHLIERVKALMVPPPDGAGLTREQALEQVQLSLGKATKAIDAKTIAFDRPTAEIIAAVFGRKP